MKRISNLFPGVIIAVMLSLTGCSGDQTVDNARYVDPFIGTAAHGHTFPGAVVPFGMVQLSPDNGRNGWDWCV